MPTADTSCERFRHISANDAQRAAVKADWDLWGSWALQVADHNDAYDAHCLNAPGGGAAP